MSKILVLNGLVLIEKYDKVRKDKGSNPFSLETNDNLGIVRYADPKSPEYLVPGTKVYFGNKHADRLVVEGVEMYAMKPDNVVAILQETTNDQQEPKRS